MSVLHTATDSFNDRSSGVINTCCEEIRLLDGDFSWSMRLMQLVGTQPFVHHMPSVGDVAMSSGNSTIWINTVTNLMAALRIVHLILYTLIYSADMSQALSFQITWEYLTGKKEDSKVRNPTFRCDCSLHDYMWQMNFNLNILSFSRFCLPLCLYHIILF